MECLSNARIGDSSLEIKLGCGMLWALLNTSNLANKNVQTFLLFFSGKIVTFILPNWYFLHYKIYKYLMKSISYFYF